jgi:AraC family transcriptional regulator
MASDDDPTASPLPSSPGAADQAASSSAIADDGGVSAASLQCASARPNRLLQSSRNLGWRSLLVDHHEGGGVSPVFETLPTSDVRLVVATRGRNLIQVFKGGRWHSALYDVGNAGIIGPLETTRMHWQTLAPDDRFENAHLYLPAALVSDVAEEFRRAGSRHVDQPLTTLVFQDPTMSGIAATLLAGLQQSAPSLYADQASRFIVTHLLARHARWWDIDSDHRAAAVLSDRQIARVLEYMSARFAEDLTLAELAAEACISVNHFVRRFRERTGVTPFAYLTRLRVEAAQRMLLTSDIAIAEIAALCGYSNAGAFSTAFQRQVGSSPSSYRLKRNA